MSSNNQATTAAATTRGREDIELGGEESRPTTITEATSHTLETIEDDELLFLLFEDPLSFLLFKPFFPFSFFKHDRHRK